MQKIIYNFFPKGHQKKFNYQIVTKVYTNVSLFPLIRNSVGFKCNNLTSFIGDKLKILILMLLTILSSILFSHEIKTVMVELNGMDFVSEDMTYGNQMIWIPEIDEEVVASGSVQGFIARYKKGDYPDIEKGFDSKDQRWSHLPNLSWYFDEPAFIYLSHGNGYVRLSYQSQVSIQEMIQYTSGRQLKVVIQKNQ